MDKTKILELQIDNELEYLKNMIEMLIDPLTGDINDEDIIKLVNQISEIKELKKKYMYSTAN